MTAQPTIFRFPRKKLPPTKPTSVDKRRWEKMRDKKNQKTKLPKGAKG